MQFNEMHYRLLNKHIRLSIMLISADQIYVFQKMMSAKVDYSLHAQY